MSINFSTKQIRGYRGGIQSASPVRPFIYKDPPKSIFTRKKERISEADTTWAFRPDGSSSDPTRINENIRYFAKGVNPSVEIDYTGLGAGSRTTAKINKPGSLYKLDSVRPPMFPIETTMAFSRPRTHQNKTVESNPGLPRGYTSNTIAYSIDQGKVTNAILSERQASLPITVQATAHYQIAEPFPMSAKWALNDNSLESYSMFTNAGNTTLNVDNMVCREESPYGTIIRPNAEAITNPRFGSEDNRNDDASGKVREAMLIQNVKPNFQVVIYDPNNHVSSEVTANIREKQNIAVRAARGLPIELNKGDGQKIKLKENKYTWTVVNTNVGLDQVILTLEDPNIELERNLPLYSAESNYTLPTDITEVTNPEYNFESKVTGEANTFYDLRNAGYDYEELHRMQEMTKLNDLPVYGSFINPPNAIPRFDVFDAPFVRTRDNSRMNRAQNEIFQRTFE